MRSESRLIVGIVIAAMAFAVGTGVVTGVDFAIAKIWLVGDEIRVRDNVQPDYLVSSLLTDKVSLRVNGVGLGTSEKEMLRLLGRPQKVNASEFSSREYIYSGLVIDVDESLKGQRFVSSIEVQSGDWNISGISIGSSIDDVKQVFGWPEFEQSGSLSYRDSLSDQEIGIDYENGRVTSVFVAYDFC